MADDMEKKGNFGQQGGQSAQQGQGQQGNQSGQQQQGGQTGQQNQQKKSGQNQTDEGDQNRDRQRRAS